MAKLPFELSAPIPSKRDFHKKRLGGAGCGVLTLEWSALLGGGRSGAVSLRSARAALDAAQKTRGKVGVSGENGGAWSWCQSRCPHKEDKILVSAGIRFYAFSRAGPRKSGPSGS